MPIKYRYEDRPIAIGEYITESGKTVREAALIFGVGKSTIHTDIHDRLKYMDANLYDRVCEVLAQNYDERQIRGAEATKKKFMEIRAKKAMQRRKKTCRTK